MDEMAIRKHVEWDGTTYHGCINFGSVIKNETLDEATECYVLMAVGINASWKIQVGYFFCNHLNSSYIDTNCLKFILCTNLARTTWKYSLVVF